MKNRTVIADLPSIRNFISNDKVFVNVKVEVYENDRDFSDNLDINLFVTDNIDLPFSELESLSIEVVRNYQIQKEEE